MNVVDSRRYREQGGGWALDDARSYRPQNFERVQPLARLGHNRWQWGIERLAMRRLPKAAVAAITDAYAHIGKKRIEDEAKVCGVDAVVLLALSPFCPPDEIHRFYGTSRLLYYLGSIDPHAIDSNRAEDEIRWQQRTLGIIGLKLHPNLQAFHPHPSDNPPPVAERLHRTYKAAEALGLYVLLHSGASNILPAAHQTDRYPEATNRATGRFGLLEHFCDTAGRSRLLEDYECPFVLAHIGSYGVAKPDHDRIFALAERYPHLSFDTSNASPRLIARFVERLGAGQLLFGSDGLYNRQIAELVHCLKGIEDGSRKERFEENATLVLGRNFDRLIGRGREGGA
jgi:predicted TIM-barrel fold metal-dependent hydrolase